MSLHTNKALSSLDHVRALAVLVHLLAMRSRFTQAGWLSIFTTENEVCGFINRLLKCSKNAKTTRETTISCSLMVEGLQQPASISTPPDPQQETMAYVELALRPPPSFSILMLLPPTSTSQ